MSEALHYNGAVGGPEFGRGWPHPRVMNSRVPIEYRTRSYTQTTRVETNCLALLLFNQGNTNIYVLDELLIAPGASLALPNDLGGLIVRPIAVRIDTAAADGESTPNPLLVVLRTLQAYPPTAEPQRP